MRSLCSSAFTERARRLLFFAREEASQLGSIRIDTEHLLLGLIRDGKGLTITREQHDAPTLMVRRR